MKRWKYIRRALNDAGYETYDDNGEFLTYSGGTYSITALTFQSIDDDGYIIMNDQNGDLVKIRYDVTSPIAYNTDTSSITIASINPYLAGDSAYTYQLIVYNENYVDVSSECTYSAVTSGVISVSTSGLITAAASGSTVLNVIHEDGPSATTTVVVGQYVDTLTVSGSSAITFGTEETYYLSALTFVDQSGVEVDDANLTYAIDSLATISNGILTLGAATGSTTLTVTHTNAYAAGETGAVETLSVDIT